MAHRLIALVLAALVGTTPVARELCDLSCADAHHNGGVGKHHAGSTGDHAGSTASGHAHHHTDASATSASSLSPSMSAAVRTCTHEAESLPASITAKLEVSAPPFVFHGVDPVGGVVSTAAFSTHVPIAGLTPVPIALRTPLRV